MSRPSRSLSGSSKKSKTNIQGLRNIKLVLEYDGARFFGFQSQPRKRTIQGVLEKALSQLLNRKTKIKAASGRTDAGVHASFQVVNFYTDKEISTDKVIRGLNFYLPREIAVTQAVEVQPAFHARYSARFKTYEYRIWNHSIRSPLRASSFCHYPYPLDLKPMRQGAKMLTGKHDFKSFCNQAQAEKSSIRTIRKFQIIAHGHEILIRVEANGFLYRMVRNLVGTLLDLGRGKTTLKDLEKILLKKTRSAAGQAVEAQGLRLIDVTY
ncbi:MAG: tRNA pseudouridine(38-40) synthase TruA [Candidatus Omnitrophica bacterium]|nr:tRNA pseudouridine(38-40) synthase TruA [Candidatus Omnitrophota bacterium]